MNDRVKYMKLMAECIENCRMASEGYGEALDTWLVAKQEYFNAEKLAVDESEDVFSNPAAEFFNKVEAADFQMKFWKSNLENFTLQLRNLKTYIDALDGR